MMRPILAMAVALFVAPVISVTVLDAAPVERQSTSRAASSRRSLSARPDSGSRAVAYIPRISTPIVIDGALDDAPWAQARRIETFHETYPGDNITPGVPVRVRVAYDSTALYIAFEIDDDPAHVRASWRQRDDIWSDDYVGVLLDTYGDASWAYMLFSNPYGIQGDTRYSTASGEDDGLDVIFESSGRVTERGYQVEMAIPFRSLRFPERTTQSWRATFWITRPRESRYTYSWVPINRNTPCFLCQMGLLEGIEGVSPGNNFVLLPAVTATQASELRVPGDRASGLERGPVRGKLSLGVRYDIGSSLAVEGTVNPDFSQVESDAAQIDVNSTFALFYPERRPFFQERADLFDSWLTAIYTRSINDPLAAVRVSGSWGASNLTSIVAWDRRSPVVLPFEERSVVVPDAGGSAVTIARFQRTLAPSTWVGLAVTDRRFDGGASGSLALVDGHLRLSEHYTAKFLAALSHTREHDEAGVTAPLLEERFADGMYTAGFDGERFTGNAWILGVERGDRTWHTSIKATALSPTFRAASGFVTQNNRRELAIDQTVTLYPGGVLDELTPRLSIARVWNSEGIRKDEWLYGGVSAGFKGPTAIRLDGLLSNERFRGVQLDGIRRASLSVERRFGEDVSFGVGVGYGRHVARTLALPVLGTGVQADASAEVKLTRRLFLSPSWSFSELRHPDGTLLFSGSIVRIRSEYQFTRELSLRLILQLDDFDRHLSIEPLLTWRLNPFSIFYIGSTLHSAELLDLRDPLADRRWVSAAQQYFLKFQYLFQF